MGYIGNSPTALPLSSNDLADDIVTSAKIADGTIANDDLAGSIANAKLLNSSVTVNGTSIDLGASGNISAGITEADIFRITSNLSGTQNPISSNWGRATGNNQTFIGTGMTESSGVFTFPSTGKYFIQYTVNVENPNSNDLQIDVTIQTTTDNSSYGNASVGHCNADRQTYNNAVCSIIFDVENTSTHKVRFTALGMLSDTLLKGNPGQNETHVVFIRLADT